MTTSSPVPVHKVKLELKRPVPPGAGQTLEMRRATHRL